MGQLGGLTPEGSIILGVFVGLGSTSIQSLGLTLQRKSHILEDKKGVQDAPRPPYRRRRWQLGMFMFLVSNIVGSTIQITTLPLPVLSALQASGLVFNSACATLILGEPFTMSSLGGTVLVCVGAVLIAIFGAIGEPAHNLGQLLTLLGRREFIFWMTGQAILVSAIIIGSRFLKLLSQQNGNSPRMRLLRGMSYGCISGILSAHSLLVAKTAVELLVRTIVDHKNQFDRWQSWLILLGLLVLAFTQLYYLNRGLKLCSTSILYPFIFCIYNIIAILDGLIYFDQTSRLSLLHGALVTLGTVILLTGVVCLSWRLNDDPSTKQTSAQATLSPVTAAYASFDSEVRAETGFSDHQDEESSLLPQRSATAPAQPNEYSTPRLSYGTVRGKRSVHYAEEEPLRSSNSSSADRIYLPRKRSKVRAEADEIWDELQEDATTGPTSPSVRRQSLCATTVTSKDKSNRNQEDLDSGSETVNPLLNPGIGRSYRDRKRRKSTSTIDVAVRRSEVQEPPRRAFSGIWRTRSWWKSASKGSRSAGKSAIDTDEAEDPAVL